MSAVLYMALGFVSLLLQLVVLRDLLTVFSGNELDIGITLSLWLASVGAGSLAGARLGRGAAFGLSFAAVAVLAEPTVAGIWLIRPALGLGWGEAAPLGGTFLATALVLFPLCFCLGLQFPLAVSFRGGDRPAAAVYGLEAAGAFAAGVLFTLFVSGRLESRAIAFGLSLLCALAAIFILRRKAAFSLIVIPFLIHAAAADIRPSPEGGSLIRTVQSRYGEIWLTALGGQTNVYASGQFLFSYPDPQSEELAVHLPMLARPEAKRVLALGGPPAALREYLKYPVERVDFVEADPALLETSVGILNGSDRASLGSGRARLIAEDGRRYVKSVARPEYDIIVLNLPPPSTANLNRFYTAEFFAEARAALREGGALAVRLPSSAGYVGRRMQLANGSIYNALREAFAHVEAATEEYGLLFASDSPLDMRAGRLRDAFVRSGVGTRHFQPYIIEDAFMPMRAELYKKRLGAVSALNTDARPSAYLYNLMLWAEAHGGASLNFALSFEGRTMALLWLGAFALAALFVLRRKSRTLHFSIFTSGYAAMALVMAILLGYQSAYGYVYEMVGLLGALFMAGAAAGSLAVRGGGKLRLMALEAAAIAFAAAMPHLLRAEALYYALSLAAGAITGCQFALVNRLTGHGGDAAGRLYASDLAGSFAGALLSAIILVPMAGVAGSLWFIAGVKAISLSAVALIKE